MQHVNCSRTIDNNGRRVFYKHAAACTDKNAHLDHEMQAAEIESRLKSMEAEAVKMAEAFHLLKEEYEVAMLALDRAVEIYTSFKVSGATAETLLNNARKKRIIARSAPRQTKDGTCWICGAENGGHRLQHCPGRGYT